MRSRAHVAIRSPEEKEHAESARCRKQSRWTADGLFRIGRRVFGSTKCLPRLFRRLFRLVESIVCSVQDIGERGKAHRSPKGLVGWLLGTRLLFVSGTIAVGVCGLNWSESQSESRVRWLLAGLGAAWDQVSRLVALIDRVTSLVLLIPQAPPIAALPFVLSERSKA